MLIYIVAAILSFWICLVTAFTRSCLKAMRKEKRLMEGEERENEFK